MIEIAVLVTAYLIGNISPAYLLGKFASNIDIREHGSGNAGTTNVLRVMGTKAGIIVLLSDLIKGVIAVLLGRYFGGDLLMVLAGLLVVVGHNWPALLKFKGGKGVATSMGVGIILSPQNALICIGIAVLVIILTKYVSLASLTGIPIWTLLLVLRGNDVLYIYLGIALSVLAIFKHRSNIQRIIKGTENKFDIKNKLNRS